MISEIIFKERFDRIYPYCELFLIFIQLLIKLLNLSITNVLGSTSAVSLAVYFLFLWG